METPVLTKLQKKLSLSGKKQKKEIIRNVLDNPYKTYWPLICEELPNLKEVLSKNLPRVRVKKVNIPWKILKGISKDDRKRVREDYIKKNYPIVDVIKEPNLVFGVNDVTKSLESDACSTVLVAEVTPRILIKHIIDLCVLNKVPILVIPGMKQILEELCGLKSIAVAIKRGVPKESNLNNLFEAVQKISNKYQADSLHINSGKLKLLALPNKRIYGIKDSLTAEVLEKTKGLSCHLHRTSLDERVFVPIMNENICQKKTQEMSIDNLDTDSSSVSHNGNVLYKPLKVKRLKGNKNRQKEKIEKVKSKKNR